jgi:hypothetical protein
MTLPIDEDAWGIIDFLLIMYSSMEPFEGTS